MRILIDLIHSLALVVGAVLLWQGCKALYAPLAPIVLGSLCILGVGFARTRNKT